MAEDIKVLKSGITLLANPFLKDPGFLRSVVLLCEYSDRGSFGLVVNQSLNEPLNQILPDVFNKPVKIYQGGPVRLDTIHFIHQYPDLIEGSMEIKPGIFWGGNFGEVGELINQDLIDLHKIKFFMGYSGWGAGQLEREILEGAWIITESDSGLTFNLNLKDKAVWDHYLLRMGDEYARMVNYPIDPSLN